MSASLRYVEFQAGWFADPLFFGHYPQSMVDGVGDRLPSFTEEQRMRLLGSYDFYGMCQFCCVSSDVSVPQCALKAARFCLFTFCRYFLLGTYYLLFMTFFFPPAPNTITQLPSPCVDGRFKSLHSKVHLCEKRHWRVDRLG